ncbi:MAG: hypothetical protein ACI8PZ_004732 [Myxococcota bacterium]|jgi:hypothetical protein
MWLLLIAACAPVDPPADGPLPGPPATPAPVQVTWPAVDPVTDPTVPLGTTDDLPRVDVRINEACARNTATVLDPQGDLDDWVELVNPTDAAVDLAGWTLSDGGDPWPLPDRWLQPDAHLVLWLDRQPEDGPEHAPFALSGSGETLTLTRSDGSLADRLAIPELTDDQVYGRFPDAGVPATSLLPTPGNRNPAWPTPGDDASDALFPQDALLVLELWLPEESTEALLADNSVRVPGALALDGVWLPDVEVRIKGQLGSNRLFTEKAALKVDLNALVPGRRLRGLETLTLNNMVQDASVVHEWVGYQLGRAVGVPSPRVAHTRLYIDGEYRGLYLHVETIDDRFLTRWFDDPNGNLYEGEYGIDVRVSDIWRLDHDEQGPDDVDDRSDLLALATLLETAPSEDRVAELEALVDVEITLRAMAFESLIGHWDGYFHAANNYRLYHEPSSGRFTLLPWGIDQTFASWGDVWGPRGDLAEWMLAIPTVRARYGLELAAVATQLQAMDVTAEIDGIRERVQPWYADDPYREGSVDAMLSGMESTIAFARDRSASVLADLER